MLGLHFTPVCVLLLVCSLHFTLSLHFIPGPQSAVCSPQSAFYTDRFFNLFTAEEITVLFVANQRNTLKIVCSGAVDYGRLVKTSVK